MEHLEVGGGEIGALRGLRGSGVANVRYADAHAASEGTITQRGGYTIDTVTAGGAFAAP